MPVVNIKIVSGRTVEQKRKLVQSVTQSIAQSLDIKESAIWISIEDMPAENFSQGGLLRSDQKN